MRQKLKEKERLHVHIDLRLRHLRGTNILSADDDPLGKFYEAILTRLHPLFSFSHHFSPPHRMDIFILILI